MSDIQRWRLNGGSIKDDGAGPYVRYADHVEALRQAETDACWHWPGYVNEDGYGRRGGIGVHRRMWELVCGPIPKGMEIDHLCRTRDCIRPDHMEVVDHRTNTRRGLTIPAANAAKTHCPQGHPYDEENTYVTKSGCRHCRACKRKRDKGRDRSKKGKP
jgi:HNH endonuclease